MDSPDMWMKKDVGEMVLRCRERVDRLGRIAKMIEKEPDTAQKELIRNTLGKVEIRLCQNIGVAIRARAKEVADYCENYLHLTGVKEEDIKKNPWIICCAAGYQWDRICMLMDAKDAAGRGEG